MTIDYSTSPLLLSILLPKFIDFSMFLRLFNTKKTPQRLIKFSLCAFNYRRCDFFLPVYLQEKITHKSAAKPTAIPLFQAFAAELLLLYL